MHYMILSVSSNEFVINEIDILLCTYYWWIKSLLYCVVDDALL